MTVGAQKRMDLLNILYLPSKLFAWHPERMAFMSGLFAVASILMAVWLERKWFYAWPLLIPAVLWGILAAWEANLSTNISGNEIRIDVLFTWPILLIAALGGICLTYFNAHETKKQTPGKSFERNA